MSKKALRTTLDSDMILENIKRLENIRDIFISVSETTEQKEWDEVSRIQYELSYYMLKDLEHNDDQYLIEILQELYNKSLIKLCVL